MTIKHRGWHAFAFGIIGILVLAAAGAGIYHLIARDSNPIPPKLRASLPFSPFVIPKGAKGYTTGDYAILKPDKDVQELKYRIHLPDGNSVWLSEYVQPSQFTEIPDYKDRFLTNVAKQYGLVQTSNGTIYLGRLTRQNNEQLGIMLEKGLLVFMIPGKELDQGQWHSLGEQLEIQKTVN
jgi:hypothetical protein